MTISTDKTTASQTTTAFYSIPADIQEAAFNAIGRLPRPMSHMEMLLAVGKAIAAERERWSAKAYMDAMEGKEE